MKTRNQVVFSISNIRDEKLMKNYKQLYQLLQQAPDAMLKKLMSVNDEFRYNIVEHRSECGKLCKLVINYARSYYSLHQNPIVVMNETGNEHFTMVYAIIRLLTYLDYNDRSSYSEYVMYMLQYLKVVN